MNINKISVKNFKVFKNKTEFELAPITLLTGPNNSGKSSFTKFLDLLSSNYKNPSGFSVLDFIKGNHQLGDFKNIINWDSDSDLLSFELDFPMSHFDENFKIQFNYSSYRENGILHSFKIYNRNRVLLDVHDLQYDKEVDGKGQYHSKDNDYIHFFYKLDVNYIKQTINTYNKKDPNSKILLLEYKSGEEIINSNNLDLLYDIEELIFNNNKTYLSFFSNYKEDFFINLFNKFIVTDSFDLDRMANQIDYFASDSDGFGFSESDWHKKIKKLNVSFVHYSIDTAEIFDKIFTNNIFNGLMFLNQKFNAFSFLSATRGNKDRIFLNDSNHEINSLIREFNQFVTSNNEYFMFLEETFTILGIIGSLKIKRVESFGTLLYVQQKNRDVLLSDLGYGLSQVIPILLKILIESDKIVKLRDDKSSYSNLEYEEVIKLIYPTIIIEEPEANLHPKLQSKLADIFVLAYKTFGIQFVIETHSEYFIRKLQYLTAKKEIKTENSVIYYFNDDKYVTSIEPKVKEIFINEDGGLTDSFGPGFFDEATKLQFDLIKLNKQQMN